MKFIIYPIEIQYGKYKVFIYEEIDNVIEVIKSYLEFKDLDSEFMNSLKSKYHDIKIVYNEDNIFAQNLKNIFIEINIDDNINEIEKSNIKSFIDNIFNVTKKYNTDTIISIKKTKKLKNTKSYYESNLYIRLENSNELKIKIDKYQKLIKIKLLLKSNKNLSLNITNPCRYKFKEINLNGNLKKLKFNNTKIKLYEQEKNQVNIDLKSKDFIYLLFSSNQLNCILLKGLSFIFDSSYSISSLGSPIEFFI